jgi:invasion protein IalB
MKKARTIAFVLPLVAALSASAQTQQSPAAKPPAASPQQQGTQYGDWLLHCVNAGDPKQPKRACEISQDVKTKEQQTTIMRIAIGALPGEPLRVTVLAPSSVSFPSAVHVAEDEKDTQPIELPWVRCMGQVCSASAMVKDDVLKRWRTAAGPGRVMMRDATGKGIAYPMSFSGLAPALDALGKEKK